MRQLQVKEVAKIAGISVRTLHYYDEIGLLKPDESSASGYRLYSERNLDQLQQILFFRTLDFPLKEIKTMMEDKSYDRLEALYIQREQLQKKRDNLNELLYTIDQTITHEQGGVKMTQNEKFKGFSFGDNPYEEEAKQKWGKEAVEASNAKIAAWTDTEKSEQEAAFNEIFRRLAAVRHLEPGAEEVQQAIQLWWNYLNQIGDYSKEAFRGLGEMYVADERFTKNIDQFGEGLSAFLKEAMGIFAEK